VILFFTLFFTILFLNGLDFLYLSNGEISSIGTIRLKISIAMALEPLLSFQPLRRVIPLPLSKVLIVMRVMLILLWKEKSLGVPWS